MSTGLPDVGRWEVHRASEATGRAIHGSRPDDAIDLHGSTAQDGTSGSNGTSSPAAAIAETGPVLDRSLREMVSSYERRLIEEALRRTRGNRARAARLLQTTERILGYRIRQYGIDWKGFRR